MRRSNFLPTLLISAAAIGLAACGSSDSGSGASASNAASRAGVVSVANVDGSAVLADAAGKTLYTAAVEQGGKIHCTDGCTAFWEPVPASSAEAAQAAKQLGADLDTVKRPDGERQLAFDGLPLYTFAEESAGKLQGDGFVDDFQGTHFEWSAARTSGGAQPSGSPAPRDSGDYGY